MHVCDLTMLYATHSGGIRRYLREKRRWLRARREFRHTLVLPRHADLPDEDTVEVPSLPLPFSRGYRMPINQRAAVRALTALRPQLIEAGDPYHFAWAALDAGQALGIPVVGFYHTDLPRALGQLGGTGVERMAEAYVRRLYLQFDLVLAPSACMAQRLRALGVERVRQQPLGVDTRAFHPRRAQPALRERLAIAPGDRLLVYFGRFGPEKNLPVLYRMLDHLGPGHVLLLIGDGAPPARSDVRHLPYIADPLRLATAVAACDAFVHAGDQETFGLATLEAMACGLPAVAAGVGGSAELVDHEVGAAIAPHHIAAGPEAFAAAMAQAVRALFGRDLDALGAAARRRAERYDWEQVLPGLARHYTGLGGAAWNDSDAR